MMSSKHVVISTKHPVAGYLYLEMIPDSEVGFSDIYQITDSLFRADVLPCDWREHKRQWGKDFLGHGSWDVYYIKQHVNRINWFDNDSIKKIKFRYSLSLKELIDWVSDPDHWIDIAVEGLC
ncbi:hypothetical protein [Klebsiella pneumoniae]|uniref:hypothetical protein n=1 Tax=Klebsiella pneumoniae TaxID=573 RepID=UPI002DBEA736|nr:hypothetical protein [Klebsiella pneumoniae]MEB5771418.1 hypothetical protein [Klebsiella pneumoniae]